MSKQEKDDTSLNIDETTDTISLDSPEMTQQQTLKDIRKTMVSLHELFDKQIARNQNQTQMFDKLYAEMKDYKESFLLEVLHKPIIHNLIQLYDSFILVESQLDDLLNGNEENTLFDELSQYQKNLENFRFKLEEVLYRMDVTPYRDSSEMLDRQLHKTRKIIPCDDPEKDQKIAEVHRIGFYWREKVFRPEEVTIFRYNPDDDDTSLNQQGGNSDG